MSDKRLRDAVLRELKWDPQVDAAHVGVSAENGVVTLAGRASSYSERIAAVRAAERVYGVRAVVDHLEVRLPKSGIRDDDGIAVAIAHTLRWNVLVPKTVTVEVRNGYVTLRGDVHWNFQRDAAERAVRDVEGVRGIVNSIIVKPRSKEPSDVRERVAQAIERASAVDAAAIAVTTTNGTVRLRGTVHSLHERKLAEDAAKAAPGVERVENEIEVVP